MSLRLEMLQVARLAPNVLGADGVALVERFVRAHQADEGGFLDRDGKSDLYYSVFALDALTALQAELPSKTSFFDSAQPEELDFVHLCSLLRVLAALGRPARGMECLEKFRTADGGYNETPGAESASAYGSLLGYAAYADHGVVPPDSEKMLEALAELRNEDGGYANDRIISISAGPSTAAAVTLLRKFGERPPDGAGDFLLSCWHPAGGFRAFPGAPMPDLLSTAVTLHALDGIQVDFSKLQEPLLDFVDSLWVVQEQGGGFFGTWDDDQADLEYTYYGLLALGHLAL